MLKQENRWNGDVNVITANARLRPDQLVNEIRQGAENITVRLPTPQEALQVGDVVSYLFYFPVTGAGTVTFAVGGDVAKSAAVGYTGTGGGAPAFGDVDPTNAMETQYDAIIFTYYYGLSIVRSAESNA